ncbi:MAG: hypothetical protein NTU43_11150 [Bacteroidetes bacterium]|nr:hypothetical protein [Bacteroidota bacterium]
MKKIITIALLSLIINACNNDPKLNATEEKAVETQLDKDQNAMDSLEKAIQEQIGDLDKDTTLIENTKE